MNKEYNIYRLMDNYTDSEFNEIRLENVNTDRVVKKTMEKIKHKKHLKLKTRITLAVAAAVLVTATITAAAIYEITYTTPSGNEAHIGIDEGFMLGNGNEKNIYKIEDGRIYFIADNQHTDITDLISDSKIFWYQAFITDSMGNDILCIISMSGTVDSGIVYNEFNMEPYLDRLSAITSNNRSITGIVSENNKFSYDAIHKKSAEISLMQTAARLENSDFKDSVYTVENDRVFFIFDGQHTDITDIVDNDTPYIYSCRDNLTYFIVGGEKDDLGFWYIDLCDTIINGERRGILRPNSSNYSNLMRFIRTEDKAVIDPTDVFMKADKNDLSFKFNRDFDYTADIYHELKPWAINGLEQIKADETRNNVEWDKATPD